MSKQGADFQLSEETPERATLRLSGDWQQPPPPFNTLASTLRRHPPQRLQLDCSALSNWDSNLPAFLLQGHSLCAELGIELDLADLPDGARRLLNLATAVPAHQRAEENKARGLAKLSQPLQALGDNLRDSLAFIGDVTLALGQLIRGKATTRWSDFIAFVYQAGPDAFAIISLTSILVGMILAYLGAVQLSQFGAEVYVADLVVIGMLREMGVLMTAIVMAGRTGAAYAAQLGTMQTNEEIDAIITMGVSPMEFLVLPRMLALVAVMPLLTIYADVLGMLGGGIVATSMGISPAQYFNEGAAAFTVAHTSVGLVKSVVFGILIAVAGCRAGINSGRSSAAVGQAATRAVVTAIVYLIIADAGINILCQQLGV